MWLKVLALGRADTTLVSASNVVSVDRFTADTATRLDLLALAYDSLLNRATLTLALDPADDPTGTVAGLTGGTVTVRRYQPSPEW